MASGATPITMFRLSKHPIAPQMEPNLWEMSGLLDLDIQIVNMEIYVDRQVVGRSFFSGKGQRFFGGIVGWAGSGGGTVLARWMSLRGCVKSK